MMKYQAIPLNFLPISDRIKYFTIINPIYWYYVLFWTVWLIFRCFRASTKHRTEIYQYYCVIWQFCVFKHLKHFKQQFSGQTTIIFNLKMLLLFPNFVMLYLGQFLTKLALIWTADRLLCIFINSLFRSVTWRVCCDC